MRRAEGPQWGSDDLEVWHRATMRRMRLGEVKSVTFDAVWRGGTKRRLRTIQRGGYRRGCKRAMSQAQQWHPPADRIQARLWGQDNQYLSAMTWQINAKPRPRPLRKGEVPQPPQTAENHPAAGLGQETTALRAELEERLARIEAAANDAPGELVALKQRLREVELRLDRTEKENRELKEAISVVWNELSDPALADLYRRLQALYEFSPVHWEPVKETLSLPEKWPNPTHSTE